MLPLPPAEELLDEAVATNDGRIELFRWLATYDSTDGYEDWVRRYGGSLADPERVWLMLHSVYAEAWRRYGEEFFRFLRFGYMGMHRRGT